MKKILLFLSFLLMSIGVFGAIAAGTYELCTSTSDLEANAHYIIANGTSGTVKCISNVSNNNNRKTVETAVLSSKITVAANSTIMTFTLGGTSGAWTFYTDNYAGTAGYLASAASGSNNYCRVIKTTITGTISFSGDAAVINLNPHSSRTLLRYNPSNGTPLFACYSSGQQTIYLYKLSQSYTITAESNNTSYGTVSLVGTTITATPASGYRVSKTTPYEVTSGTATVTQSGNVFTVTTSVDCTIRINFEIIPTHTLSFNTKGILTFPSKTLREDSIYNIVETINDDLLSDCEYTKFVGWTTKSGVVDSNVSPTILSNITINTQNITLYAVFRKGDINEQQTVLYGDEIHNGFQNHNYNDNEACYEDTVVTWCGKFHKDVADRKWIQIRKNDDNTSYIKIVFKERTNVNKILLTVTSTSNASGGINDMTTHNTFGTPVSLNLSIADTLGNDNGNVICSDTTNTVDNYQILTLNPTTFECDSFYIITDGTTGKAACRIWGIQLFYDERVNVKYSSIPRCYKTNFDIIEWNNSWIKLSVDSGIGIKSDNLDYVLLDNIKQPDSTYKADIDNLDDISCTKLPIIITNKYLDEYVDSVSVPILIHENNADNSTINNPDSASCDLVILGEGKLTLTDDLENRNVTVYPRGVLNIPSDKTYIVNSLTLRRDNDEVPYLSYKGTLDIKNGMFFEIRTDGADWRWVTLPDTFTISNINGNVYDNIHGGAVVKYYDGVYRAEHGVGGWKLSDTNAKYKPGEGVIFGAYIPTSDAEKRIYRVALDTTILSKEKADKSVPVQAYGTSSTPANDKGWNVIGNPYIDTYKPDFSNPIRLGYLEKEIVNGQWTGKWVIHEDELRYIVVKDSNDIYADAGYYKTVLLSDECELKPFTSFFVQVVTDGEITFNNSSKVVRTMTNKNDEVFLRLNVGDYQTGCFISNKFNDTYEIGDDIESLYSTYQLINGYRLIYSAVNDSIIEHGIEIHTNSGIVSLDEKTNLDDFEVISILYDNEYFDLLQEQEIAVNGDFILFGKRKIDTVATGLFNEANQYIRKADKILYNSKVFILKNNHIFTILGERLK